MAKNLCYEYLREHKYETKDSGYDMGEEDRPPQYHLRDVGRMMNDMDVFGR